MWVQVLESNGEEGTVQRQLRADRWNLMDLREMLDVSKTELCRGASEQSSRVECWNLLGSQEAEQQQQGGAGASCQGAT